MTDATTSSRRRFLGPAAGTAAVTAVAGCAAPGGEGGEVGEGDEGGEGDDQLAPEGAFAEGR